MISLKAIQTTFTPNHGPFPGRESLRKRRTSLSLCNSKNSDEETPPTPGDKRKQELLARIAMLQTQKVRLTDFLDERSEYLTQFAEEANAEIDLIGENALKELDEAGARVFFFPCDLALMGLVVIGIVDASVSSSPDWRKIAFLGVILAGLITQFFWSQHNLL